MDDNYQRLLAELQESRFAAIFRLSPLGICISTLQEGTFLDANPAFLKTENLKLEEILGKTSLEMGYWRNVQERQKVVRHLQEIGTIINWEMSHRLKDGTISYSLRSLERITVDGRDCILTMLTDITNRKSAEQALQNSEQRYRALIEHSFDAIALVGQDGKFLYGSPAATRITGRTADEWTGRGAFEQIHPDDAPRARSIFVKLLENPALTQQAQFRYRHKNDSWIWLEVTATNLMTQPAVQAIVVNYRDITARQRTEEALRASEERFAKVFRNSPDSIALVSLPEGRVIEVNDQFVEYTGYSRDEVLGRTSLEIGLWEDSAERDRFFQRASEPLGTRAFPATIRSKSGELRDMQFSSDTIELDGRACSITTGRDVTSQKRAEETHAAERQLLRTMADNLPGYVFVKDTAGRYLFVNVAHVRQLGQNSEAVMLGKTVFDFFPADIARAFDTDDQTVFQTGQPVIEREEPFEIGESRGWFLTTKVPLRDAQGTITGLVGIALDITARKQAEVALIEERNLLRTVVDHIPDFIFVKDIQSRQVLNNKANLRLIGAQSEAEVVGKTVFDFYPTKLAQRYYDEDQRVMYGGHAQLNQEESMRSKDGQDRWLLASKVPLRDVHGTCIGLVGIKRDITEQRRATAELTASRERLEMLSRQLIATQEFERRHLARELHDEIGQALTGIKLNIMAMQDQTPPPHSETLVADTIAVVDHTLQQVRSLALDLRPSMLDELGLAAAVRWCLNRQARQAGFAASFVTESANSATDPDIAIACFRVAQESLTNIARHAHARNVRVELYQRETELDLLVQDDGRGFEVASARDRAARGSCLGLLGMEERVQLVGGQIEINSAPAGGTTIRAWFPLPTIAGEPVGVSPRTDGD